MNTPAVLLLQGLLGNADCQCRHILQLTLAEQTAADSTLNAASSACLSVSDAQQSICSKLCSTQLDQLRPTLHYITYGAAQCQAGLPASDA
jgi:hypothetical protein